MLLIYCYCGRGRVDRTYHSTHHPLPAHPPYHHKPPPSGLPRRASTWPAARAPAAPRSLPWCASCPSPTARTRRCTPAEDACSRLHKKRGRFREGGGGPEFDARLQSICCGSILLLFEGCESPEFASWERTLKPSSTDVISGSVSRNTCTRVSSSGAKSVI